MATRGKNSTPGRLNEIVAYRRSQGGSVSRSLAGGIKERLKEKFDPRQLINQRGLMTALFPGLKTYQAKTTASEISKSSTQLSSFDEIKPILETISFNTKMTAKNTMVLPALHRDVNVIRQNMVKLVKIKGGDARTKADMYFVKAKDREDKYERELKKERNKRNKTEKIQVEEEKKSKGFLSTVFSSIVKALELVVESVIKLGKAILGVFKFLAGIIVDVISGISKFLFNSLLGIGKLLSPLIADFIKDFFTKGLLAKAFIRGLIGIVWRFLTGGGVLMRLGLLLSPFLAGLGFMIVRDAKKEAEMYQDKDISIEKELSLFSATGSTLPTSEKTFEGEELSRAKLLGIAGEDVKKKGLLKSSIGKPIEGIRALPESVQNELKMRFHPEIVDEFKGYSRDPYNLIIPGMSGLHDFLLTTKEAREYGDKTRDYLLMLNKENLLNREKMKFDPSSSKFGEYQKRISIIRDEKNKLKAEMLTVASRFVTDQIGDSSVAGRYMRVIESLLEGKDKKSFFDTALDTGMRELGIDSLIESVQKEASLMVDSTVDKIVSEKNNFKDMLSRNIDDGAGYLKDLTGNIETKTKDFYASNIIDLTQDNRKQSVVYLKQPIVINQDTNTKQSSPYAGIENPASAWNSDFINTHFPELKY